MAQLTDLEKVRKRRARRRAVKGFLTLAVFALVVFGCAVLVRQAGDVNLRTAYSDIKESLSTGEGYPVLLPGGSILGMDATGDTLVVLSDTNLYTYNGTGRQMMDEQHGLVNPALRTSGDRILLYDRGNNRLNLYTKSALIGSGESAKPLYTADLADNGNYVVVTEGEDTLAKAVVYNDSSERVMESGKELFTWNSAERPIISVSLADGSNELLVGHVAVSGGEYQCQLQQFLLSYDGGDIARTELNGELVLWVEQRRGGSAWAVTDQRAVLLNDDLQEQASFRFDGLPLAQFTGSADGHLVLVLGSYDQDKQVTVCALSPQLELLAQVEVPFQVRAVQADGQRFYLCGPDSIRLYQYDGTEELELPLPQAQDIQLAGRYLYYMTNQELGQVDLGNLAAYRPQESSSQPEGESASGQAASQPEEASEPEAVSGPEESSGPETASGPEETGEPEGAGEPEETGAASEGGSSGQG